MKLVEFNPSNTHMFRAGKPTCGINWQTGLIVFSKRASEMINIKPGDQIVIHQDAEDHINFYVEKVKTNGFPVREQSHVNGVCLNNTALARKVLQPLGVEKSASFFIAGTPTVIEKRKLWGLLLRVNISV